MGTIPKKHTMPTKWRIIYDLSWPVAHSLNDGIPKELVSCTNNTLDQAVSQLKLHGQGASTSKLALSDVLWHILVGCDDWELLGSTWPIDVNSTLITAYFVDAFLPFRLRSSPALFLKVFVYLIVLCGSPWGQPCLELSGRLLDIWPRCLTLPLPNQPRYRAQHMYRSWL